MPSDPFLAFLLLLVISLVVSAILHYGLRYYVTPGVWSFCSKVVVGYIGAWIGTPVFGRWWTWLSYGEVFVIPAILGAAALLVVAIDVARTWKQAAAQGG